ncbi:MAG: carboxypeptidase regulatory-like domain-containing protein [Actinomycetota bacterium]|nr:carboxypeptidase regulatory-like domain-containing protein [Actinomycetota bacterium]
MRVEVTPRIASVSPGVQQPISITITNTSTVIGGYVVRVLGADPGWIELDGDQISLFPDETRVLVATITPPRGIPAGNRRIAIQVRELTPPHASTIAELDLTVPASHDVQLRVDPLAVTAGKQAAFSLLVENTGNTPLVGRLDADDPEGKVGFSFLPERLALAPGEHSVVDMRARARRHFTGSPTVRMLAIYLDQQPADSFFAMDAELPPPARDEREALANATFIQRSVLSRGALSLLGLLVAVTVFALVITIALSKLVGQTTADRNLALQVAAARNSPAATGTSGVAGTVSLLTSAKPVAGVAVSVFSASDTSVAVATTATDTKGAYQVGNLAAGKYKISFRGAGFVQLWYPGAATDADATTVTLAPNQVQAGLNVSLGGVPASIAGTVVGNDVSAATLFLETIPSGTQTASTGPTLLPAPVPGVATPPNNGGAVLKTVPIGSDGSFSLTNVPSPSIYDLVVTKVGYATSTQRIDIGAGESRTGVQLTLSKGDGLMSGTVTNASGPLGGATITATSGQSTASTVSLTVGAVGSFTLRSLPTPATFTVVASAPGFASQTLTLTLSAGQKLTGVAITLSQSSGSLGGVVTVLPTNARAPGVAVTVTDGLLSIQTVTESTGNVGTWKVAGLAVPGTYTVTFTRIDLASQTVSVSLDASGNITPGSLGALITPTGITVNMQSSTATVFGRITQAGGGTICDSTSGLGEATVGLNSGSSSYTVTSASVAPNCGQYRLEQIPPGTYTLTVSAGSGTSPSSQVITLTAGASLHRDVALAPPASMSGKVQHNTGNGEQPRAGWTVFLYPVSQYPSVVSRTTVTDRNGNFSFQDIDAGKYIVAAGPTSDPANATNTIQVTVQPSTPRINVIIEVGQ